MAGVGWMKPEDELFRMKLGAGDVQMKPEVVDVGMRAIADKRLGSSWNITWLL
jgi:hypothetical protein